MRLVSVLMADIQGSTAIAERLGPERSKLLFDEVTNLIGAQVRRFGGTVAQLSGDGVLAVFGAPEAHDDDAERAVLAGIELQRELDRFGEQVRTDYDLTLAGRVAIEAGRVVVDWEAGNDGERFNALGDPVNLAARLQQHAEPGTVLVGPELARAVGARFELDDLGEVDLRGISHPVRLLRVDSAGLACDSRPEPALVGRDFERTVLERAVAELCDGLGVVMVVTGEAGIGKTRLIREVVAASENPPLLLEGRSSSYATGFPLWPVRDLLRGWMDLPVAASESRMRLELKARLTELFGELGERYVFLSAALGLTPEGTESAQVLNELSRENVRDRAGEAVAEVLCSLSEQRPVLVVMDDLHWADEATIAVCDDLLDLTEQASVGFALVYRSERESSAWKLGQRARERLPHRYREVELRALAPDAGTRLAESVAGASLPPEVAELVAERAGGNPFFIEEAIRDLVERDVLAMGENGLELCVEWADVSVPVAVQTALQARLGRLSPAAREVATLSAAVGRAFGMELLEKLVGADQAHAAVLELQRLDLITEERRRPSPEYRFRHGLVQEVAYSSMLEHDRHDAHRRIAEALQELAREAGTTPPAPVLARHLAEADMPREAADALIVAGDDARALWATAEAVDDYRRARTFLARLNDERRSRETLFKIALVHHVDFDFRGAERAYDEAFACKAPLPEVVARDQRLRTMLTLPPEVVPGYTYVMEAAVITDLLFRGLLAVDRDQNVVPSLAENMRVSSDGLSYLFQLHDGLRWSDGEPLTTHDFTYTWEQIRALELPTAFLLDDVTEVVAHDDRTLEIILAEPRNAFLYLLAHSALRPWPRHVVQRVGPSWRTEEMVTNGPFKVAEMDGEHLLAVADPYWQGPAGNLGEIEFTFVPMKPNAQGAARWAEGEFDVLAGGGRQPVTDDLTDARTIAGIATLMLWFVTGRPGVSNLVMRKAIAAALDPVALVELMENPFGPARGSGLLPPALPGHSHRSGVSQDLDRAAQLLSDAGYPEGRGAPELVVAAHEWLRPLAELLCAQLAAIGVKVSIVIPEGEFACLEPTGDADMFLTSWGADYPDPEGFFRGLVHSSQGIYSDETTDRLMVEGRAQRDHDRRLAIYQELDRHLVQQAAVLVPIGYPRSTLLVRPWVSDVWATPATGVRLGDANVDPLRYPAEP
jgi:ABC-type transport system substrate-binding protein/class 3 adenylate cyclase